MILRAIAIFLLLISMVHSEESRLRESKSKTEATHAENQHGTAAQQITVPANSLAPTIVNVYAGKHSEEESSCTQPKNGKEWISFAWCQSLDWINAERMIAIWTVILGLATCILGVATWKLWRSTEGLVKGADLTSERQLRAYITVFAAGLAGIEPGKEFRAGWMFQNDGLTPAHDLHQNSIIKLTEWPLPDNFPFPVLNTERRSRNNVSPRSGMHSASEPFDHTLCQGRAITQADIIQIFAAPQHGRRLVIFGEIHYKDEFEKQRSTRFCASYGGNPDLLVLAQQGNWQLIEQFIKQPNLPWGWELANRYNTAK